MKIKCECGNTQELETKNDEIAVVACADQIGGIEIIFKCSKCKRVQKVYVIGK